MKDRNQNLKEEQKEKLKRLSDQLEQGVRKVFEGENYRKYLTAMAKLHNYSEKNCILILHQRPDATMVASYTDWKKKYHRQVKKGEKGIRIFCPAPYKIMVEEERMDPISGRPIIGADGKIEMEQVEKIVPNYKICSVFDISQTEGEPFPEIVKPLVGEVKGYRSLVEILKKISPVPVYFEEIEGSSKGYYHPIERRISIQSGMSQIQTVKTLCHEITHAKLHDSNKRKDISDRNIREVEAESVAFVVCSYLGLDTSEYSFGYIASYIADKELKELKKSIGIIRNGAHEIIDEIEKELGSIMNASKNNKYMENMERENDSF